MTTLTNFISALAGAGTLGFTLYLIIEELTR